MREMMEQAEAQKAAQRKKIIVKTCSKEQVFIIYTIKSKNVIIYRAMKNINIVYQLARNHFNNFNTFRSKSSIEQTTFVANN